MLYLEDYLEVIEGLHLDLEHTLTRLREKDLEVQTQLETADKRVRSYFRNGRKKKADAREASFQELKTEYETCLSMADEKVQLANHTYDLVDRHIRRLDVEMKKFAAELDADTPGLSAQLEKRSLKLDEPPEPEPSGPPLKKAKTAEAGPSEAGSQAAEKKIVKEKSSTQQRKKAASVSISEAVPMEVPVGLEVGVEGIPDENEPRYCICNQVSYGDMVGCDNDGCLREWFHYVCMGITEPPKGKWYCPECTQTMKRRTLKA
eukprot:Colp12_sorted_trinity150504_noHs@184